MLVQEMKNGGQNLHKLLVGKKCSTLVDGLADTSIICIEKCKLE